MPLRHWSWLTLSCIACDVGQVPFAAEIDPLEGTGDVEFAGYEPLASRPLRVFFHVPDGATADSPVVMVLHGVNRDADAYRDSWIDAADRYGFVIAAPQFRDVFYPNSSGYALGNVFVNGNEPSPETLRDPDEWTFHWLEPLFDDIVARTPSEADVYQAFGHSAGAQFLHRLVQFVPDGRYQHVIAANAGWYTVPDDAVAYPYGLGGSPIEGGDRSFFGRGLVIHNGGLDADPDSANLRHTPEADAQGAHRFERGGHFYERSAEIALEVCEDFRWQREIIAGVGHSQSGMAERAAPWLAAALGLEEP